MKGWRAHDCSPFTQDTGVASAVTDKVKDVISSDKMKDVASKVKSTLISEGGGKILKKGADKLVKGAGSSVVAKGIGKVGSRLVPGAGYALAAKDAGELMMKTKAKGYAELDKKSPGTSKHLETGAYGQQTSDSGHKVRGTFFGSMK